MEKALVKQQDRTENAIMISKSLFMDMQRFEAAQRVATLLASSSLVPLHFQKSVANCVIALNLADRLQVDPFMLMQNIYVVHGRPGIEGKLAIALIEGTGRFSPLKFKMTGQGKTARGLTRPDGCLAYSTEKKTGEVIEGPPVTWEMAEAEGWTKPKGTEISKWQTMPDLMFRYRSAMFFARVNCPGALLGLRSSDEIEDIEMVADKRGTFASTEEKPDPTADLKAFEESIPDNIDLAALDKYLSICSGHFKRTVDAIKTEASKNMAAFLSEFAKWQKRQGKAGKQEATEKATEKPAEIMSGPATTEAMAPGPCPSRLDTVMTAKYCNAQCTERSGCPTWKTNVGE